MRLEGKVAIVTGGARGIGLAYAQRFLDEGASVVVADINERQGDEALASLATPARTAFLRTDVTDPASVDAVVAATVAGFGGVDIVINNAALYGDWDMRDQSYEYLKRVFDVNLHGVWLMTRAAAPALVERGGGAIINQASGAAYNYKDMQADDEFPGLKSFNYSQTKWGVVGLTKYSAGQLGRWNIRVNCIAPGVIDTEATRKAVPGAALEAISQQQAIRGVLNADDLTGAAVFFASDDSRFITGQVLVIDGGRHMPA